MGKNIKILISEKNNRIIESLTEYFCDKPAEVNFCAKDGFVLLEQIKQYKPDVVLCDVFMSGIDAIAVKERTLSLDKAPKVFIIISAYDNEDILKRVMHAGFNYYFIKPFSPEILYDRIMITFSENSVCSNDSTTDLYISGILRKLEVPSHLKGYAYIQMAVKLILDNPSYINNITKQLYPEIAKAHHSTASRVERSIRTAIETGWERAPENIKEEYFPYYVLNYIKPTNKQFLAVITDIVKSTFTYEKMS